MVRSILAIIVLMVGTVSVLGQTVPTTGLRDNTPSIHALLNARIVVSPGNVIPNGTVVIRNGIIEAAAAQAAVPADARIWNMQGQTLYPGLIDLASDYGLAKTFDGLPSIGTGAQPPPETVKGAAHWNAKARAEVDAAEEFQPDPKTAEKLRSQGLTLVQILPQRGLFRGSGAVVSTGDGPAADLVVKRRTAHALSFDGGGIRSAEYPNSLMGAIAFIRQTWIDAEWYRKAWESFTKDPDQKRPETNNALAALQDAALGKQTVVFEVADEVNFLRAARIAKEFSLQCWIRSSGKEYRQLEAVKGTRLPLIVPVSFPDAPAIDTPEDALNVSLDELQHWDAAPENAGRLSNAGIPIALTASLLKDASTFLTSVRKAVDRGLSVDAALASLTTTPAKWLGVDKQYGSLEKGKTANIVVTTGDLFNEKSKITEVWIDGKRYEVKVPPLSDPRGTWALTSSLNTGRSDSLMLKGELEKPSGSVSFGGREIKIAAVSFIAGRLTISFIGDSAGYKGTVRLSASTAEDELYGVGELPDGSSFVWKGVRVLPAKVEPDTTKPKKIEMASFPDVIPPGEYGRTMVPDQPQILLVKNATIWTQGSRGRIEGCDLLVAKGKILQVGKNLPTPGNAIEIDGTGKHVTPGMIDCHSHTAAASINEGTQAVTCETRIEDVLNPYDISIYYQLAGGTTMANVLHGSANPIGGQNAVVKWRWGGSAGDMLMQGAPPGVKFALGENVKQTHWSQGRYPRTRMGVEQLIRDRFLAALDYERSWKEWEKNKSVIPPRRDLELESLVEIVKNKRLIHAHSYRQDEIMALLRVAEEFGVKIATFQHVLEGYKVAEAFKQHGASASGFTDWWAYKIEAFDAIPGNFPLLHRQGVLVSYNSDDDELARRLNTEAAKALPFGINEEEALSFVTLHPAKQLGIADKVGSLEQGKDADFVIWNGNPLSVYTKCEQTWIDGRKFFDVDEDIQARARIQTERSTLIQKILSIKQTNPPMPIAPPGRPPRFETLRHRCEEGVEDEI